jgi:hypothetical protein|tara:strand:+ start:476 stop:778 length:303 start_codon:yes stop_codon:yes gene_type:complete
MRPTCLISHTTAFLLFIVVASGCGGVPDRISYDDDSITQGIYSPLTNPVVENLSSTSDPVEQIDVPIETSPGVDGAARCVRYAINGTKKMVERSRDSTAK